MAKLHTLIVLAYPSGSKNVEVLLQHMFEGEIDPNDTGGDLDLDQLEEEHRPRAFTLDNVT